jgi:hypothetical protein
VTNNFSRIKDYPQKREAGGAGAGWDELLGQQCSIRVEVGSVGSYVDAVPHAAHRALLYAQQ